MVERYRDFRFEQKSYIRTEVDQGKVHKTNHTLNGACLAYTSLWIQWGQNKQADFGRQDRVDVDNTASAVQMFLIDKTRLASQLNQKFIEGLDSTGVRDNIPDLLRKSAGPSVFRAAQDLKNPFNPPDRFLGKPGYRILAVTLKGGKTGRVNRHAIGLYNDRDTLWLFDADIGMFHCPTAEIAEFGTAFLEEYGHRNFVWQDCDIYEQA